jgi:hypothetical protein
MKNLNLFCSQNDLKGTPFRMPRRRLVSVVSVHRTFGALGSLQKLDGSCATALFLSLFGSV